MRDEETALRCSVCMEPAEWVLLVPHGALPDGCGVDPDAQGRAGLALCASCRQAQREGEEQLAERAVEQTVLLLKRRLPGRNLTPDMLSHMRRTAMQLTRGVDLARLAVPEECWEGTVEEFYAKDKDSAAVPAARAAGGG